MEKSASERFLNGAYETLVAAPCTIEVEGRKYKVRQVSQKVKERIALLEQDAQVLEIRGKEGVSSKEARKITKKLFSLHAKKAAYYLLGNWAIFFPFVWAIQWRILQLRGNETTFRINEAGVVSKDLGFFKANWDVSRQERGLYMRPIGESASQAQERLESVMNMLDKDALGIKEENK